MKQRKRIWVVVADEAIARILSRSDAGDLQPEEEFTHAEAHARGAEMQRDAFGRRGTSVATSAGGDDKKRQEAEKFAREVAQRLLDALNQDLYDELRVAAAPRFLGLLRKALAPQVSERIREAVSKDLIHLDPREIAAHVFPGKPAGSPGG